MNEKNCPAPFNPAIGGTQDRQGSQGETKCFLDLTQISLNPYCVLCVFSESR